MGVSQSRSPTADGGRRGSGSSAGTNAALVQSGYAYVDRHPYCRFATHVRTFVGVITASVMFWAGIVTLVDYREIPISIFLLFAGVPVFLLEFGGFIRVCCGTDGACCRFFSIVLGLDRWGRGIFYTLLGAVCMMPDVGALPAKIAGGFLLASAIMYFAKSFQKKKVKTFLLDNLQSQQPQQSAHPLRQQQTPEPTSVVPVTPTQYRATSPAERQSV